MAATLNSCSDVERLFAKYIQHVLEHRGDEWAVAEFVSRLRHLHVSHARIEQALNHTAEEAREILEAESQG